MIPRSLDFVAVCRENTHYLFIAWTMAHGASPRTKNVPDNICVEYPYQERSNVKINVSEEYEVVEFQHPWQVTCPPASSPHISAY
jgi:hypothetical protein